MHFDAHDEKSEHHFWIELCVDITHFIVGSSAALTLMMPFTETDVAAPFPHAFAYRGLNWAKYVIAIGALFGIITSLLGTYCN